MKTTRKLTMAAIMVMVALLAFVGSTFAWMTVANNITTAEPVTGTVQGAKGIYVRFGTSGSWGTEIKFNSSNVQVKQGNKITGGQLVPLAMRPDVEYNVQSNTSTTYKTDSFSYLKDQNAENQGINHFDDADGGYIEFTLQFYSDAENTNLYPTVEIAPGNGTSPNTADNAAVACTRVLLTCGNTTLGKKGLNGAIDIRDTPTVSGAVNFYSATNNPSFASFKNAGILSVAEGGTVSITEKPFMDYKEKHDAQFSRTMEAVNSNNLSASLSSGISTDSTDPTSVTVRIYIEGWDSACTNYIAGTSINVKFIFSPSNGA